MKFLLSAILLMITGTVFSQRFGGNPPSVKWSQVNNPATRVIFPKGLDSIGRQVAGIVQQLSAPTSPSIGERTHKIDIVLHNQTTYSNAYVGLGPYRSEFYLTPPQNSFTLGSLPWPEQLAIHEFRHVQQNNNFNVGLSRVMRIVFGEEGQALANSLVVPDWFYEGDAVYNETNVSSQGRGRLPSFFNDYRSLWEAGKNYSWMKLRNGSYRDFTPDHYRLGYMLAAYGREKYGNDFWKKVTQDAAAYKGLFYPFQKAVKKYADKDYKTFRQEVLSYFQSQPGFAVKPAAAKAPAHFVADEEYPAVVNDSTLVFMKDSYKHIPAFMIRSGNTERKLRVRDYSLDNQFSYRNGNIVYASYRPDLRWGWKDYSELKVLDTKTGIQRSLTRRSKYFSPDISADGTTIVAVFINILGQSELHFLDAGTGQLITEVPNPDKLIYTFPKFYNARQVIAAVKNTAGQMSLTLIDGVKGTNSYLTPFSYNVIGFPVIQNDTVYFSASHGTSDRIFAYSVSKHQLFRLVQPDPVSNTGDYQPAVSSDSLFWSHFTVYGNRLTSISKKQLVWEPFAGAAFASPLPSFGISAIDKNPVGGFSSPSELKVSNYSASYQLLNFHSLHPLVDDPVYSFSLVGENVLNTLQSELFFSYNRNEQFKQLGFNTTYGALFPYISAGADYTFDRRGLYHGQRIYWNEAEVRAGLQLPFTLSKGRNFTGLNIGADYVFNKPNFKGVYKDSLGDQSFSYINMYISFYNQIQQAKQHIYPRFAQSILINYKRAISNFDANQFLASGYLYLPGLFVNHNLVLNTAFQQKDTLNQRSFSNNFPFSRGYTSENFHQMIKWGVNYHFPLAYPDAGFGNIIYLLRLRANVFYDYTKVTDARSNSANFRSTGTEVFFDTKWWNQLPLSLGFRYSYLLDRDLFGGRGSSRFEFVLPVNIIR
ncbi:MAG: hypothetical protein ABIN89_31330 [Chitinophagaceae bacterium]